MAELIRKEHVGYICDECHLPHAVPKGDEIIRRTLCMEALLCEVAYLRAELAKCQRPLNSTSGS